MENLPFGFQDNKPIEKIKIALGTSIATIKKTNTFDALKGELIVEYFLQNKWIPTTKEIKYEEFVKFAGFYYPLISKRLKLNGVIIKEYIVKGEEQCAE